MAGKFITIEGIDGSGKSTQSDKLCSWLENYTGRKTTRTFEPGGWPGGNLLREFILGSKNFCAMSELLLFLADRSEHVNKIIIPELEAGNNIICERYNDSTLAYQSGGHALEISRVYEIIRACNFPEPDIKILLAVPPEIAFARIKSRNNIHDKFEDEGIDLMRNVSEFYRSLAEDQPDKFIVINCENLSEHEIFSHITSALTNKLEAVT